MTERPILFSGPMVRAILDGRKTQTRRVIKPQPESLDTRFYGVTDGGMASFGLCHSGGANSTLYSPILYKAGDLLWVRECFSGPHEFSDLRPMDWPAGYPFWYWADGNPGFGDWTKPRPSIHMPKSAARIWLHVTGVRVERLQEIKADGAALEGLASISKDQKLYKWGIPDRDGLPGTDDDGWPWVEWEADARQAFRKLWDTLNAKRGYGWETNSWVSVIEFERVEP